MSIERVNAYFAERACGYGRASAAGLWRFVRSLESRAVMDLLGPVSGLDCADLGAGAGFYSFLLLEAGAAGVLAVDACPQMLARISDPRIQTLCADIGGEPAADRMFSRIVCAGALEFAASPASVLSAARAIAAPDCVFVLLVPRAGPLSFFYKLFHRAHGISVRLFGRSAFRALARDAGWRVGRERSVFPFGRAYRLAPGKDET